MRFWRIRGVKRSVFAENAKWNGAFSAKTRYSQKFGYVLVFNTYLIKIFEILGLGLVYYWMMPKNCEKRTIKSHACVPLRSVEIWAQTICAVLLNYKTVALVLNFKQHHHEGSKNRCSVRSTYKLRLHWLMVVWYRINFLQHFCENTNENNFCFSRKWPTEIRKFCCSRKWIFDKNTKILLFAKIK